MKINRRDFVTLMGSSLAAGALLPQRAQAAERPTASYGGTDMADWTVVLGDALWNAPATPAVAEADIATVSGSGRSTLWANTAQRPIMAHNITYKPIVDSQALTFTHTAAYDFRLPFLPQTQSGAYNAQTIEGSLFIWDGGATRLDYGCAFQWVLNPWLSSFGHIHTWTTAADGTSYWMPAGFLQPDTAWHRVELVCEPQSRACRLSIDGVAIPTTYAQTIKPDTWGTEMAARLSAEIVSIWPHNDQPALAHQAEFKDWSWNWQPTPTRADRRPLPKPPAPPTPRRLQLDLTKIRSEAELRRALGALMAYPEWFGNAAASWLALVAAVELRGARGHDGRRRARTQSAAPRFGVERYEIELIGAMSFARARPRLHEKLLLWFTQINQRALTQVGHPLISVTLL